jgi:hypothetical protein
MARGQAKGKDGASIAAKGTLVCGSITLFMGFLGMVMALSSIRLKYDDAALRQCGNDPDAFATVCKEMPNRANTSIYRRRLDANAGTHDGLVQAMESLRATVEGTATAAQQQRRKLNWFSKEGSVTCDKMCDPYDSFFGQGEVANVCSVDHKLSNSGRDETVVCTCIPDVNCSSANGQSSTAFSELKASCGTAPVNNDGCFGPKLPSNGFTKACCEGVCGGMNDLVHAKCYADADDDLIEECTCKMRIGNHVGDYCPDVGGIKTTLDANRGGYGYSSKIMCTHQTEKKWANCGLLQEEMCAKPWADRDSAEEKSGMRQLRNAGMGAGFMAIFGTLPPIIAAIAKMKGKESLETTCTMVGAFSSICCGFCGTAALSAWLFLLGALFSMGCNSMEELLEQDGIVGDECNENCKTALDSLVGTWCDLGRGLSTTSTMCALAAFFGLMTAIYSCISHCKRRKQVQPQVIIMQQPQQVQQVPMMPMGVMPQAQGVVVQAYPAK